MVDEARGANAAALARLSANIERWRQTRTQLSAMPETLWREAVAVSRSVGVRAVATECGLNATRLKASTARCSACSRLRTSASC